MTHWQVFETPLPGYAEPRFLRCAVWANAPRDALITLHNHDRAWHSDDCRHIAIWEDNHKHDPIDGLVHWVVDARGQPINGQVAPAGITSVQVASPLPPHHSGDDQVAAQSLVPQPVQSGANSLPWPAPAPTSAPVGVPNGGTNGQGSGYVARETPHTTDATHMRQLAAELEALKAYIRGQTLADLAFQEHALLEHARRSGDVNLIKSAEASAASSFGPEWRTRIPALLDKGRALDAAALQS